MVVRYYGRLFVLCPCALVLFLVSPWGCVRYRVAVALSPGISLWPLGGFVFVAEDGDFRAYRVVGDSF